MSKPKVIEEMKRHVLISALAGENFDLEIATFLKVARSFDFKVTR